MPRDYTLHDHDTAPQAAREWMDKSVKGFGRVPNLHKVMANTPIVLEAYHRLWDIFGESSFSKVEQQVVYQASNITNACHYCVPAHFGLSLSIGMDEETAVALANAQPLPDPKLEALRVFTVAMIERKGHVTDDEFQAFLDAGWTQDHALEITVGLATKVLSNYTNALAGTPIDDGIAKAKERLEAAAAGA